MGFIGPLVKARVAGNSDHDFVTLDYSSSRPKAPVVKLGEVKASSATVGAQVNTFNGTAKPDPSTGSYAIPWLDLAQSEDTIDLVIEVGARKVVFGQLWVDEANESFSADDGTAECWE
jgi:hypothetical protein